MEKYRKLDLFTLELGSDLCLEKCLNEILKTIPLIREEIFDKYGVVIPNVCVKDNKTLKPLEYVIKVNGYSSGRFEFRKNSFLILDTGSVKTEMTGKPVKEPVFGAPGLWITKGRKAEAEQNGYVVLTAARIIKVHLIETIKENLSSVITTQYVGELLDEVLKENEFLCTQIVNKYGNASLSVVKIVLCSLLDEEVSIRNLIPILETISNEPNYEIEKLQSLVNKVRCAIIPDVIGSLGNSNNDIKALVLSQKLSQYMFDNITETREIAFDSVTRKLFSNEISLKISEMINQGFSPVVLCVEPLRYSVKLLLVSEGISNIHVFSDMELSIAVRNLNISLQVFATIGEDFELPAGCDSGASVHEKLSEATQPKKNSNEDFVKLQEKLNQIVGSLEPFEQKVISMRFGLGEEHSHTLEEVGLAFDIPLEKIRMIEAKALHLLQKNVTSEE